MYDPCIGGCMGFILRVNIYSVIGVLEEVDDKLPVRKSSSVRVLEKEIQMTLIELVSSLEVSENLFIRPNVIVRVAEQHVQNYRDVCQTPSKKSFDSSQPTGIPSAVPTPMPCTRANML